MADSKVAELIEPQYGFWEVCVLVNEEDSETGKVKKVKEVHLVDARDPQEVQTKVLEEMKGTMWDWNIESCKKSKINYVY